MWWMLLIACAVTPEGETASQPSESDADTLDTGEAWTGEGVRQQLIEVIGHGLPDAELILDAYLALLAEGDEFCPGGDGLQLAGSVPVKGCTAESGVFYQGISTYSEVNDESFESWVFTADMTLRDADGLEFGGGGTATVVKTVDGSVRNSTVAGSWGYGGGEGALADGYSAGEFSLLHSEKALVMDGGFATGGQAVDFIALHYHPACDGFQGAVDIRSPRGHWWTVTFVDGCAKCGVITDPTGEEQGEVCLAGNPTFTALFEESDTGVVD